jgi:phosphoglycerate kinase
MLTLDDLPPGRRLLVRLDLNTAVEDGAVRENRRFARHAATLARLLDDGHAVACLAHQGRPGRPDFTTLERHADILADHLGRPVGYVPDTHGEAALAAVRELDAGEVVLLENVRMTDDELADRTPAGHGESALVRDLAPAFDAYVDDAYSAAHRAHASLVGFPEVLPAYAGPVMAAEHEHNTAVADREFDGHVVMVLGGAKAADVVRAMDALSDRVDRFLLGGVVGELALRARGHPVGHDAAGTDLFDDAWAETGDDLTRVLEASGDRVAVPVDLAHADDEGRRAEVAVEDVAEKRVAYEDVGTETLMTYAPVVRDAAAVFVKGALGVFEDDRFSVGTVGLLEAVADTDCFSVVGGGDTSRAVDLYDLDPTDFDHLSVAGGAYLRALTGEPLPAVEALDRAEAAGRRLAA